MEDKFSISTVYVIVLFKLKISISTWLSLEDNFHISSSKTFQTTPLHDDRNLDGIAIFFFKFVNAGLTN